MDRALAPARSLDGLLLALADGGVAGWCDAHPGPWADARPEERASLAAQRSVAAFWLGDFADATAWAARAVAEPHPRPEDAALAQVSLALAACGDPAVEQAAAMAAWRAARDAVAGADATTRWWSAVRFLVAESALASARVGDARAVVAAGPLAAVAWEQHPFHAVMVACELRVAVFSGAIDDAIDLLARMRAAVVAGSRIAYLADSLEVLVGGNAGDPVTIARAMTCADQVPGRPADFLDRGAFLLLAFGAIAAGDVRTAAAMILRAGADGDLGACTVIDRALGLEALLVAALDEGDLPAASAWATTVDTLVAHPAAGPSVLRVRSRVALAEGRSCDAVEAAEASIAACLEAGRVLEAAEGEIVLARARIAGREVSEASRRLRTLVAGTDATGHHAVRRAAASALQPARRRLPPVAGGRWAVLTARESEVARLLVAGHDVDEIAATLVVSPHTVRIHVSRVLCAFGVATRVGLLAELADPTAVPTAPGLTPRQAQVARLVAGGATNVQVAAELGISVKGVEKHVSDVLTRWDLASRFELARRWWSLDPAASASAGAGKN